MPFPHGQVPGVLAGGRLTGRWRYDRTAGRGIALSYERSLTGTSAARRPDVHHGGRFTGRWRYVRTAGRGIALSYDRSISARSPATAADPEPIAPLATPSGRLRVLCSCGDVFTFEGDAGICPRCGRPAEWPTMGEIEREMRSDLEALLRDHESADPD